MTEDRNSDVLAQLGTFSPEQLQLLANHVHCRTVPKGAVLLSEGAICQTMYYGLEGAFYQVSDHDEQEPAIIDLHGPGQWFFNHHSFVTQTPSAYTLLAYTDGTVLELTIQVMHDLIAVSPVFLQLASLLNQATDRIRFFDGNLTPLQKYQYILDYRPQLMQAFPLKMIAAYLKVAPETLSRVRERLARGIS
ncbi:Crp/Fnr family transcriptional regulator [Larkinella sp. VNQ87]|uniref:Crp/Fnr family transcriptional regulator n=1 Tax=Larkinella sp. VNQ87 TaxID=3400921 RepID=UPI003C02CDFB